MEDGIIIYKGHKCKEVFCSVCGKVMFKQPWEINKKKKNNLPFVCKSCTLIKRNKDNLKTNCIECGTLLTSENEVRYGKNKYQYRHSCKCKDCFKKGIREKYWKTKIEIINHYGGKCVCCGETIPEFLTIDHVNNDGKTHRKENPFSEGSNLYKSLIKRNFDIGYELQLLCWNCNEAKIHYGICPHQRYKQ